MFIDYDVNGESDGLGVRGVVKWENTIVWYMYVSQSVPICTEYLSQDLFGESWLELSMYVYRSFAKRRQN